MPYWTSQFVYSLCTQPTAFEFSEPYTSIQHAYGIAVSCRLLATTWCIAVSGVGLVHLVYNAVRNLPVCIQFMYTAYASCTAYEFREPYRSLQEVYEFAVHFRSCHDLV